MNTTTIGQERLRTLYAVMAGMPSENVNLRNWRRSQSGGGHSGLSSRSDVPDADLLKAASKNDCGTTAHAVGVACAYPEFQTQGLHMEGGLPFFDGAYQWGAVTRFFDLNFNEAEALFAFDTSWLDIGFGGDVSDRVRVLARIRRFLCIKRVITEQRSVELATQEGMPV